MHWPEHLIRGRRGIKAMAVRVLTLLLAVRLRVTRVAVVRTVHNVAPHEALSRLDRFLLRSIDLTDSRIIMNTARPFPDDVPTTLIPHGHYRGFYETKIESSNRAHKSGNGTFNFLFFGLIRKYKQVDQLLHAFSEIDQAERVALRVLGSIDDAALEKELKRVAERDSRISLVPERVSDDNLIAAILHSDLVVLPYQDLYNSGAALLALSLHRPILIPDSAAAREYAREIGDEWVLTYTGKLDGATLHAARGRVPLNGATPDLSARDWAAIANKHLSVYGAAIRQKRAKSLMSGRRDAS